MNSTVIRFVVVGDGFPAAETIDRLLADEAAELVAAYSTEGPEVSGNLSSKLEGAGVRHRKAGLLKDTKEEWDWLGQQDVDWLVNINSTVILPREVLEVPAKGALNMHPGPLPRYAGLHCHQWAIRNGETEFGCTVHHMEPHVDTGNVVHTAQFPISETDTGLSLFTTCMQEGSRIMVEVLDQVIQGDTLPSTAQDLDQRTLYRHRDALDGAIAWTQDAASVERFVRAGNYEPFSSPSYTPHLVVPGGSTVEVLRVAVVEDSFEPEPPGTFILDDGCPPLVFCGDGGAVEIHEARLEGGSNRLDLPELNKALASLDPEFPGE